MLSPQELSTRGVYSLRQRKLVKKQIAARGHFKQRAIGEKKLMRAFRKNVSVAGFCLLFTAMLAGHAEERAGLAVAHGPDGKAYLSFGGEPLFAFGPGDEFRLIGGAADLDRWAEWQRAHGMNLLRAYPASVPLSAYGASAPHPFLKADDGDRWDVDQFNDAFFDGFRERVAELEAHEIIVHLQLWQIVFFKGGSNRWEANYLNPNNNVNEWTRELRRGHDYIDAPADSRARAHQREWVRRMLDTVKGRNNVWIDVINELGNEMGELDWAIEVVGWIREWEAENDQQFLVGVDSEHHYRPEVFGPVAEHFDLVILNELQSVERGRRIFDAFGKPIISVRSSDGRNHWSDYVFANAEQVGPEHQTRYRTLCYRSLFANLQSIGTYWKMEVENSDYRDMEHWPRYAEALRSFWKEIRGEWPGLRADDAIIQSETVTPHAHGMASSRLRMVYLECGSHTWNNEYSPSELVLAAPENITTATLFHPATGSKEAAEYTIEGNSMILVLPAFTDDLVVLVWSSEGR